NHAARTVGPRRNAILRVSAYGRPMSFTTIYKAVLVIVFLVVIFELGQALYFMMTDRKDTGRTACTCAESSRKVACCASCKRGKAARRANCKETRDNASNLPFTLCRRRSRRLHSADRRGRGFTSIKGYTRTGTGTARSRPRSASTTTPPRTRSGAAA